MLEAVVAGPFLLMCAFLVGIAGGSWLTLGLSLLAGAVAAWRLWACRVTVEQGVVTVHGLVSRRRYEGIAEVRTVSTSVGWGQLPAAGVAIVLRDGTLVELPQLQAVPFLQAGDEQARRSAAWLAAHLGLEYVEAIDWS